MKQTLKIDEINNLLTEFFEPMEISEDEKTKRIALAEMLFDVNRRAFTLYDAMQRVDKVDEDYLRDYLKRGYEDALENHFDYIDEYFEDFIFTSNDSVVKTTIKNNDTSDQRAVEIAENDANCFSNYDYDKQMQEKGFKYKTWQTMRDERVRHTHIFADGQEVPINEPFTVGSSKMMYPTDISLGASASEIINCRCSVEYK